MVRDELEIVGLYMVRGRNTGARRWVVSYVDEGKPFRNIKRDYTARGLLAGHDIRKEKAKLMLLEEQRPRIIWVLRDVKKTILRSNSRSVMRRNRKSERRTPMVEKGQIVLEVDAHEVRVTVISV